MDIETTVLRRPFRSMLVQQKKAVGARGENRSRIENGLRKIVNRVSVINQKGLRTRERVDSGVGSNQQSYSGRKERMDRLGEPSCRLERRRFAGARRNQAEQAGCGSGVQRSFVP